MALGTTENKCLFVSASVFGLVSVWFLRLKTELILKIWSLNGFYFYNCFDTDWKEILLVMVILFLITWWPEERNRWRKGGKTPVFCIVSVCTILFSLYCCSLEDCEHFPTNAIKIFDSNIVMFFVCYIPGDIVINDKWRQKLTLSQCNVTHKTAASVLTCCIHQNRM